jgi:hypothetical protein
VRAAAKTSFVAVFLRLLRLLRREEAQRSSGDNQRRQERRETCERAGRDARALVAELAVRTFAFQRATGRARVGAHLHVVDTLVDRFRRRCCATARRRRRRFRCDCRRRRVVGRRGCSRFRGDWRRASASASASARRCRRAGRRRRSDAGSGGTRRLLRHVETIGHGDRRWRHDKRLGHRFGVRLRRCFHELDIVDIELDRTSVDNLHC